MQQLGLKVTVDLPTQMVHVHVNEIRVGLKTVTPDLFSDHRPRNNVARIAKQVLEERELLGSEFNGFAGPVHGVALHVELEVGEGKPAAPGLIQATPRDRPNAGQELRKRER